MIFYRYKFLYNIKIVICMPIYGSPNQAQFCDARAYIRPTVCFIYFHNFISKKTIKTQS